MSTLYAISIVLAHAICGEAGQPATLGRSVPAAQRRPMDDVDHSTWDGLLKLYVDTQGYVDYAGWKASAAAQARLDDYLQQLSAASLAPDGSRAAKLAFWINAYNAVTIKGILREYPTRSIRDHTSRLFGYNIWQDLQLIVAEQPYSLDAMEHQVLRKLAEPRIHFAIVCAAIGCPRLRNEAYTADQLETQLADNTREFFADSSKFQVDRRRGEIRVSPILKWYAADFGESTAAQLRTISPYLPAAARTFAESGSRRVTYLDYDWNLNDQAHRR